MLLNINSIRECTESEGIGKRFAIWTQGCMKRCRNCCNVHMQPIIKKHILNCDDIIEQIQYSKENYHIEGITLLGGEPILQSKGLAYIAKWCRENNLSVIHSTGLSSSLYRTFTFIHPPKIFLPSLCSKVVGTATITITCSFFVL